MEIERKWLLNKLPNLKPVKRYIVEAVYLVANDDQEVRIRKLTPLNGGISSHVITLKGAGDISRPEFEIEITENTYNGLRSYVGNKQPIIKDFYEYKLPDGHKLEVSIVDNSWCYAEIEFKSKEKAVNYKIPRALGEVAVEEITYDWLYKMKNYWRATRL